MDFFEFNASLVYMVSFRPGKDAIVRPIATLYQKKNIFQMRAMNTQLLRVIILLLKRSDAYSYIYGPKD